MSISNRSADINELKSQAIAYYSTNADIIKKVESGLNELFYESPHDVFGFLSEYFRKFSKSSTISRVESDGVVYYDAKNQPSFHVKIYCFVNNVENEILRIEVPCYSNPEQIHDSSKMQQIMEDDMRRREDLHDTIKFINDNLSNVLKLFDPLQQHEIDENLVKLYESKQKEYTENLLIKISEELRNLTLSAELQQQNALDSSKNNNKVPSSPKGKKGAPKTKSTMSNGGTPSIEDFQLPKYFPYFKGFHTISSISKAICTCSTIFSKKQLFFYINELASQSNSIEGVKLKLPKPLITVLQNGKGFPGKQSLIKEIILIPKPNVSIKEGIDLISKVNNNLRDSLYQSKTLPGAVNRSVTDIGCLTCALETPQQGLDMIEAAIHALGAQDSTKLSVALNIGASELFDQTDPEKLKYEIAIGTLKLSDELVEIYVDLVHKYPRIMLLIEPFSKKDTIAWYKLYSRIGKDCLIANVFNASDFDTQFNLSLTAALNQIQVKPSNNQDAVNNSIQNHQEQTSSSALMPLNFYKFESSLTITDFVKSFNESKEANLLNGVSCSSNESMDSFITDLATGVQSDFFKIGGFNRAERVNKINRLIEIEQKLKDTNLLDTNEEIDLHTKLENLNFHIPEQILALIHQAEEVKVTKGKK